MAFQKGNAVEVVSKEDGLAGSYYKAKVIKKLANKKYIVQYFNLVEEEDSKVPLREVVEEEELRPVPPKVPVTGGFSSGEIVDAFDNDGWWVGVVSHAKCPDIYEVRFESYKKAKFATSELRVHQDWVNSKYWLTSEYN
ncbi:DUF724 domain-containing protein 3 [Heracleum sosnowskyi]|uniref:DUF724 domain-containing protein 3 n=1 Tax=Heracleum sosnowskyi TaxID=360622 RepID=A0AAD8LYI4_9APIA|nr:DUF724 domain-containing protein 3 [Heracleum sosnowskyi]